MKGNAVALSLMLTGLLLQGCGGGESAPPAAVRETPVELVVYSARKEHLIQPLFARYQALTGVEINYITGDAAPLLARLQSEGASTPVDLLLTVDAGNLWHAAREGVLLPLQSAVLERNVPANLRDAERQWYALTIRARTLVYHRERVEAGALSSYEALAEPEWRGRLCLRTAKKVYNQSLVATLVAAHGVEQAETIVRGWVANLAVPPFANDTMAMEALLAGRCDVTLVNTYYFASLQRNYQHSGKPFPLAIFWPNQAGRGVHVNISGGGVVRHADQPAAAQALLEWLTGAEAQAELVALNQEYPVNRSTPITEQMESWGEFTADPLPVSEAGRLQAQAIKLMDRAGYR